MGLFDKKAQPNTQAEAGWLPDPLGRYQYRYWEGGEWSGHVSTNGVTAWDPPEISAPVAEASATIKRARKGAMLCKELDDNPLTGDYIVTARSSKTWTQKIIAGGIRTPELEAVLIGEPPPEIIDGERVERTMKVRFDYDPLRTCPSNFQRPHDEGSIQVTTLDGQPIGYLAADDAIGITYLMREVNAQVSGSVIYEGDMHISLAWYRLRKKTGLPTFEAWLMLSNEGNYFSGVIAPA